MSPPAADPGAMNSDSDSDDVPLGQRKPKPEPNGAAVKSKAASIRSSDSSEEGSDSDASNSSSSGGDDSSDDDKPLGQRQKAKSTPTKKQAAPKSREPRTKVKRTRSERSSGDERGPKRGKGGQQLWKTLKHCGVLFPPEYVPHGVKMLYEEVVNGQSVKVPVDLTPDQEEVATMFAIMKETDYMNKPLFLKNFWAGFKEVLGKKHKIQALDKCDFTPIFDYLMAEREKKKAMTKEEKEKLKKERELAEGKYKTALVDGRVEPVGNFRVEPPGLFRGRGEHPKMGMIKKRIYPRDITINIGEGEPLPEHPYPGQQWKEVKHDHSVTWLAYWKDTISNKDFKYVFLGATSTFKADSDLAKYEKARALKEIIHEVRRNYESDLGSKEDQKRQMAVALYFIDKLALRAGHEKDEDEADTVGCCTLKVENVECLPPCTIRFDFLGKDSIRYENSVEVDVRVYSNVEKFRRLDGFGKKKVPTDQLFDTFDAQDLNKKLKEIMPGLSVKVFRTYNASIVLDRLLHELEASSTSIGVDEKKADYDKANKEVAILCNHQRSESKAHGNQMEKLNAKLTELTTELQALEDELKAIGKGGDTTSVKSKIEKKKAQLAKAQLQARVKEDLKTVALGTSKINYMDPRITVAWCKRNEVPIEKVFNKSLLGKFSWAMEVEPSYRF
ncbi:DNA topoisomerase I [Haematococcus lacustris]